MRELIKNINLNSNTEEIMIIFSDKLWPIILLCMYECYGDYEDVDENDNIFRAQLKDISTALDADYTDAQTKKEKEDAQLYDSAIMETDHVSKEAEHRTSKFMTELYDLYAQAVKTDEESITRRLLKDGKKYTMHIKKLKDVSGLKTHNLRVSDDTVPSESIIYINNPVESNLPNTFLSQEQFKKVLFAKAKRQREDTKKEKTLAQIKWTKKPNALKQVTKQKEIKSTHKRKNKKDKNLKYATDKEKIGIAHKNIPRENNGKPQTLKYVTKKKKIRVKHKNVYKENNVTPKILKVVTKNKEIITSRLTSIQSKVKTTAVTVKTKAYDIPIIITKLVTEKPQERTQTNTGTYKSTVEVTTDNDSHMTSTVNEIDTTTTRNNLNSINMDTLEKVTKENLIVKPTVESVIVKTTTPITTTTKQGRPYVFMGNSFENK